MDVETAETAETEAETERGKMKPINIKLCKLCVLLQKFLFLLSPPTILNKLL